MLIQPGQSKDDQYPDQDGSRASSDAHMTHLSTRIGVIVKRVDLDAQNQIEDSAEDDEYTAGESNHSGSIFFHVNNLTIQPWY